MALKNVKKSNKIRRIKQHFRKIDPILFPVLEKMELEPLAAAYGPAEYFPKLCREIISQQLGSGAARAILGRFVELFPKKRITPTRVLTLSEKNLRATGMSWAKARYLRDLAQKTAAGEIHFKKFSEADDAFVISELTKVKGIGAWTAEMFLIFTLGREDVFSFGDLGLRRAFELLYGRRRARTQKNMESITKLWSPYRSYASLALWHVWDSQK